MLISCMIKLQRKEKLYKLEKKLEFNLKQLKTDKFNKLEMFSSFKKEDYKQIQ